MLTIFVFNGIKRMIHSGLTSCCTSEINFDERSSNLNLIKIKRNKNNKLIK